MGTYITLNGIGTWSGWYGTTSATRTLSFTASTTVSGSGLVTNVMRYSLDGGSTWTTIFTSTTALASASYSVSIPSGQNLSLVQVQAASTSSTATSGSSYLAEAGSITVSGLQIA